MAIFQAITLKGKTITLDDNNEIHRGGEGRILLIDGKLEIVAKIYHQGVKPLIESRFNQLQKLDKSLFIRPIDLLTINNQPVGFTMEYAGKDFFPLSSLFTRSFCQRNGINDKYKTKIANQLVEAVKLAHFNGFIIGDLNHFNVLLNLNGEIRLIDVDSYETPGYKHSGILLDEIRDYFYQGNISMNSDYFALSILIFNLLTYTHPFKGVHDKYKSLAERMINKLPVFANDPKLKVPKCYEPVQNKLIQEEFAKQYLNGERFLFSLVNYQTYTLQTKPALTQKIEENNLTIQSVFQNKDIRNVYFRLNHGLIKTAEKYILFNSNNKGYISKKMEIDIHEFDQIYVGNDSIIGLRANKIFNIKNKNEIIEIKNFKIPNDSICHQLDNILITISSGQMYWIYLDEVLNSSIRTKRIEVFSETISHHNGLLQNTGGIQRLFYNTGKDIASIKTLKTIKKIYQNANIGVVQYIENNQIANSYFRISGLKIEFPNSKPEAFSEFGYMSTDKESGFVFEQGDNRIMIRRTSDFEIISEIKCNFISAQTTLFYTNSGIIAWENDGIYLINQK